MKSYILLLMLFVMPVVIFSAGTIYGQEVPAWVLTPPLDENKYIFGVGDAKTSTGALQSALSSINGKITTVISSAISSNTTQTGNTVTSFYNEEIKARTLETTLSGYDIIQSTVVNGRVYVLVRLSKATFLKDAFSRLQIIDSRLTFKVIAASRVSKLRLYLALNEIKPDAVDAIALVYVLQTVNPQFDAEKYLLNYRKYQAQSEELLYNMHFKVLATPELASVEGMVVRLLGAEKLSASTKMIGPADATIVVNGNVQNSFLFSEYTTQLRVSFQIRDSSGREINAAEHVVAAGSMVSFNAAMLSATNMLEQQLTEEGILTTLGLGKTI